MVKAILLVVLGAVGYHLYANAADRDLVIYRVQDTVSTTAGYVAETTKPDLITALRNR